MNDLDELNFTPLPPVTDQDLAMVRGVVNSNRLHMIKGLASVPLSEEFDFLGCDGRPIRIPDSVRHPGHKLEGAAQAAHMLRLTLTGDPKLALDSEGQLWACWEDSWRPTSDLLSLTEERDKGYDKFVRATLAKHPGLPVLQPGVRFANVGLLRGGEVVMPDDPRFNAPWAMSLDDEEFTRDRAILGLQAASTITTDMNDAVLRRRRSCATICSTPTTCWARAATARAVSSRPCSISTARWARRSASPISPASARSAPPPTSRRAFR